MAYKLLIDGALVDGASTLDVINPAMKQSCLKVKKNKRGAIQMHCHYSLARPLSRWTSIVTVTAVCAVSAMGGPCAAAAPGVSRDPATNDQAKTGVEQIVVTATRRETKLERTPISISVLSAKNIQESRVESVKDIETLSPSLEFAARNPAESYLSIRGASNIDDSTGSDQSVSMFVDDVVRTSVADLQPNLFDLDHVEILRGPQGTLFGRNSIAGVVSIYTKPPVFRPEAKLEASYGSHDYVELNGLINMPLVADKLALRVDATGSSSGGYIHDLTTGKELGGSHIWSDRAKLLFTPTDTLRFLTTGEFDHKQGSGAEWQVLNFQPALYAPLTSNPNQADARTPSTYRQTSWGLTERADLRTAIGVLTSISGYRHLDNTSVESNVPDRIDTLLLRTTEHDKQFTEEVRLASTPNRLATFDGRLSWIVGGYYLNSRRERDQAFGITYLPGAFIEAIGALPSPVDSVIQQSTHTTSWAPFIDATYALTHRLSINLGARYTSERKTGSAFLSHASLINGPSIAGAGAASWSAFTPKATLSYHATGALLLYATAAKGFQSGGFTAQGTSSGALATPYSPEYVWNYEGGFKFDGFGHRLQVNLTGFDDLYTNLLVASYNPQLLTLTTQNAGAATIYGAELDAEGAPFDWLSLGVKYNYLHARFTKYLIDNGDGTFSNYAGNIVPFSPTHRVTASFEVHQNLGNDHGRVALGGDYTYRTSEEYDQANAAPQLIRNLSVWNGVINMHASWTSGNGQWEVELWGKNITARDYSIYGMNGLSLISTPAEFFNPANIAYGLVHGAYRTFGLTARTTF